MSDKNKKLIKILIFALAGMGINLVGRIITGALNVPLWLDSVGTVIAVYMGGPFAGIGAALVNLFYGLADSQAMIYIITSLVIAGAYILFVYLGALERLTTAIMYSFPLAIVSAIVSTPINMVMYAGSTGNVWGDTLKDMLTWRGVPAVFCAFAGEFALDLIDKQVCVVIAFLVIFLLKKKIEPLKMIRRAAMLVLAFVIGFAPVLSLTEEKTLASAVDGEESEGSVSIVERSTSYTTNYTSLVYDNSNGLMSAEANAVAETEDGVIWIGSYAGLMKYDGATFEFVSNPAVASVTTLFVDSRGVLWIGTNDGGLVCYEKGEYTSYTKAEGASSNSVRSITENPETGDIYFGTTDKICKVSRTGRLRVLEDVQSTYTISLVESEGIIYAADYNGSMHVIEADEELATYDTDQEIFCLVAREGKVYAAGAGSNVYTVDVIDEGVILKKKYTVDVSGINYLGYDGRGKLWVCANDGVGYIAANGEFFIQHVDGFDNQINSMHYDYQDNIWLTSARRGVAKLCENQFENLFATYEMPQSSVNVVIEYEGRYYCGTDTGLAILGDRLTSQEKGLISEFEGIRIRGLLVDSNENLWIATYGDKGLVKLDKRANTKTFFNQSTCDFTANNVRCVIELKDGTIAAGTTNGINFIKNNTLVATITSEDGLDNAQILNLSVGYDGTLYAGTDGAGLYYINNYEVEKKINTETGLSSDIVMRTMPYDRGLIVVVTNGIYYLVDDELSRIDSFPYFNNFDVMIIGEEAYIMSSAGVFVVDVKELVSDSISSYDLYGTADGLSAGIVSNSWNCIGSDDRIYLCTNVGVLAFGKEKAEENRWYKFDIDRILADGVELELDGETYTAPKGVKNIVIYPSVRSYELGDIMVRFYVEGLEAAPELVSFKQLKEKNFSWVNSGQYIIHLQLFSRDSKTMLQEKNYILTKEKELWESTGYSVYLIIVILDLLMMITFTIVQVVNRRQAEKERAALRKANEEELTRQIEKAKQDLKRNEKENQIKLKHQLEQTISALAKTVDAKDAYTNGHSSRVAKYAVEIARRYGNGWETEEKQNIIGQAGLLHDVGKIKIPDAIINKPGKLNDAEYDTIKTHSEWGYSILKEIEALPDLASAARHHHERYDGTGYPTGLRGDEIPIMARIIAVADSYDAMTSNRSYRRLLPQDVVRDEIVKGKGSQFDPVFADIMVKMIDEDTDYRMNEDRDKEDGINYDETWKRV